MRLLSVALLSTMGLAAAAAAQTTPAPAPAPATGQGQTPPSGPVQSAGAQVTAGATVYDTAGAVVGQITQVVNGAAAVNTGSVQVGVPVGNFAAGPNGPVLGMTKAQLEAAAQQGAAQGAEATRAALVPGAEVRGVGGTTVIGTVKAVDGDNVTITSAKGGDVRLPVSGFAKGPNGLIVGLSAADFDKAVAAARR